MNYPKIALSLFRKAVDEFTYDIVSDWLVEIRGKPFARETLYGYYHGHPIGKTTAIRMIPILTKHLKKKKGSKK